MSNPPYFRPRNWGKYQSRSNNSMAWIKIQTNLLSDPDFANLTELQQLLWCKLLMLFGRIGRPLPWDSRWIGGELHADSRGIGKGLKALELNGFIQLCNRTQNLWEKLPPLEEKREERKESTQYEESSIPARARDPAPQKPNGADKPDTKKTDDERRAALDLIDAFDAAQKETFGEQRRQMPNNGDLATCLAWTRQGLAPDDLRFLATTVFAKLMAQNRGPPSVCKYLDGAVRDFLASNTPAKGNGSVHATQELSPEGQAEIERLRDQALGTLTKW